jgi:hypothetical protein
MFRVELIFDTVTLIYFYRFITQLKLSYEHKENLSLDP